MAYRQMWPTFLCTSVPLWVMLCNMIHTVDGGIDCFKCVSINGDNPACDDPFHNNYTSDIYESPCMGGRKGRNGLFPATACIKMNGVYDDSGHSMTVRGCALDSGTLTTDTELIRMSHCGGFYFNDRYVHGCVQSCDDADACNGAPGLHPSLLHWLPALFQLPPLWSGLLHQALLSCTLLKIMHHGVT